MYLCYRFRLRECNLLVCTPMLEEGVELPRCNLVVRFDPPSSFRAMVQSRGRARVNNAHYITLVEEKDTESYVVKWAQSLSVEKVCYNFNLIETFLKHDIVFSCYCLGATTVSHQRKRSIRQTSCVTKWLPIVQVGTLQEHQLPSVEQWRLLTGMQYLSFIKYYQFLIYIFLF